MRGTLPRVPWMVIINRGSTDSSTAISPDDETASRWVAGNSIFREVLIKVGGEDLDRCAVPGGRIDHIVPIGRKTGVVHRAMTHGQALEILRLRAGQCGCPTNTPNPTRCATTAIANKARATRL